MGLVGGSSIAFAEEKIKINHIDLSDSSLRSMGQFIPGLVGVFNLTAVLWGCVNGFTTR